MNHYSINFNEYGRLELVTLKTKGEVEDSVVIYFFARVVLK